eukprot:symbB.v1.2.017181.t1/scaffold1291.1/size126360/4
MKTLCHCTGSIEYVEEYLAADAMPVGPEARQREAPDDSSRSRRRDRDHSGREDTAGPPPRRRISGHRNHEASNAADEVGSDDVERIRQQLEMKPGAAHVLQAALNPRGRTSRRGSTPPPADDSTDFLANAAEMLLRNKQKEAERSSDMPPETDSLLYDVSMKLREHAAQAAHEAEQQQEDLAKAAAETERTERSRKREEEEERIKVAIEAEQRREREEERIKVEAQKRKEREEEERIKVAEAERVRERQKEEKDEEERIRAKIEAERRREKEEQERIKVEAQKRKEREEEERIKVAEAERVRERQKEEKDEEERIKGGSEVQDKKSSEKETVKAMAVERKEKEEEDRMRALEMDVALLRPPTSLPEVLQELEERIKSALALGKKMQEAPTFLAADPIEDETSNKQAFQRSDKLRTVPKAQIPKQELPSPITAPVPAAAPPKVPIVSSPRLTFAQEISPSLPTSPLGPRFGLSASKTDC